MPKRVRILLPGEAVTATAQLLEKQAPATCEMIWDHLPFEGPLQHGIWSGPETYLQIDPNIRIPPEHVTTKPLPGEIAYYSIEGGHLVEWPRDMAELAFFYGRGARPSMPDGPVAVNLFARIVDNLGGFADACERIRGEGQKPVRVERIS